MDTVKVCRICLIMDVNMYDLQTHPLQTYFEILIGNPLNAMELPPFACFECTALVKKYYNFRDRCLKGQSTLYGILQTNGKITRQVIQKINWSKFQLASNLSIHKIIEDNVIHHVSDDDSTLIIKKEPAVEDDRNKFKIEDTVKEEICFDKLSLLLCSDDDDEIEDSTEEESIDNFPLLSSDDDELLLLENCDKVKKVSEKEKKKGKEENKEDIIDPLKDIKVRSCVTKIPIELTEIIPHKSKKNQSVRSEKRRRKIHSDVDIGDLEEYVTVVKLSIEEQTEEINKRQQSSNYLNAPYQCKLCYKGFLNTQAWKHHLSKHDPSAGDIECPICKFRFKTDRPLRTHAARHSTKYVCNKCPYVSRCTNQARRHESWHKGVTYECQYCGEVSSKWTSHLSHVRIKHPSQFICNLCGFSFVSKLGLNTHKSRMHKNITQDKIEPDNGDGPDLYCKECDVQFISMEAFQRHMVTSVKHTQITNNNKGCRLCGEIFKNSKELRIHRKVHARKLPKFYGKKPSDTTWPLKCEQCSEVISNARDYWNHFRRSHPDKDYPIQKDNVCDICGKSFKNSSYMVYHKSTHSEERAHKCGTCGKAFRNTINLHNHERIHSDVRPYPCTMCYKAFKCKGALDRHFRCHTGVKPYVCQVCGKGFSQSNGRKLHIATVHMKQPAPPRSRIQRKNKP